ncbi:hypothetical protein Lesp02_59170 [Lentzea sp. NBRC 105346]|uniref:MFS transporter n=1 Tax=Lentzea sp. NBRC 105346 TaxID=3032205 RepID=UPI0024A1CFDA|nr:MFS transporter [Lentzea sp. NBRC 105346]GLZ33729.1 hypothetical protein Lesp02_59170 [Lentzea sp. NBRC 105346]
MWRYLTSAGLARLADEMVLLAVVFLVQERTDSKMLAAVTAAAYTLPSILSGPLLGAWLDRTRRPLIALAGNQFVLATMTLGMVLSPAPWLPVLALVSGVTLPMTSGGFTSMLPRLGGDLARVTAYDSMLFSASAIVGPAAAGVVAAAWSPTAAMVVIAGLAVAGGVVTLGLRLAAPRPSLHDSLLAALRAGTAHLVRMPPLRAATVTSVVSFVGFGMLPVALPWLVQGLGSDRELAGLVFAALDLGILVSVIVLRPYLSRWRPERILFVTTGLYAVSFAAWTLAPDVVWLAALAFLAGLASGPTLTVLITARQRYTPADLLGQVSTTGASLKIGAFSLGAFAAGPLLFHGPVTVVLFVAGIQLVAVLAGLASQPASVGSPA